MKMRKIEVLTKDGYAIKLKNALTFEVDVTEENPNSVKKLIYSSIFNFLIDDLISQKIELGDIQSINFIEWEDCNEILRKHELLKEE